MKFQNCILINFVTDGRTSRKQYAPSTLPKLGGIIKQTKQFVFNMYSCMGIHYVKLFEVAKSMFKS